MRFIQGLQHPHFDCDDSFAVFFNLILIFSCTFIIVCFGMRRKCVWNVCSFLPSVFFYSSNMFTVWFLCMFVLFLNLLCPGHCVLLFLNVFLLLLLSLLWLTWKNGSLCHDQCLAIQLSSVAEAVIFLDNMNVSVSDFAVWSYYFWGCMYLHFVDRVKHCVLPVVGEVPYCRNYCCYYYLLSFTCAHHLITLTASRSHQQQKVETKLNSWFSSCCKIINFFWMWVIWPFVILLV